MLVDAGKPSRRVLPAVLVLHLRDRRKIDRPHQDLGRVQPAELRANTVVQLLVIMRR
jgi:hypothetical protein